MSKITIALFVIACAVCINADADPQADANNAEVEAQRRFDEFFKNFNNDFENRFSKFPNFPRAPTPVQSADSIRNLKANDPNTHVSGTFTSSSSSFKSVNGVPVEQESSGRKIVNNDGEVQETAYGN